MREGTRVDDKFEIVEELGSGGMATVYSARQPSLDNRLVAIKFFSGGLGGDGPRRFIDEASRHASLNHPNIVKIYDSGKHEGRPYLVMDYVDGKTLAKIILDKIYVGLPEKLKWMEQLCLAVAYAHSKQIIHRDIKPSNVMVLWNTPDKPVQLLDFGIACFEGSETAVTEAGTASYMAPEQHRGEETLPQSDQFALGVVFYELLTNTQAFPGRTPGEIRRHVLEREPTPLNEMIPGLDKDVIRIVERALRKNPVERHKGVFALAQEIAKVQRRLDDAAILPPTIPPQPVDSRSRIADLLQQGRHLLAAGQAAAASEVCRQVRDLDEFNADAHLLEDEIARRLRQANELMREARAHLEAGALTEAGRTCERALGLDQENSRAKELAAELEFTMATFQAALHEAQALLEDGEVERAQEAIAQVRHLGVSNAAMRAFERDVDQRRAQVSTLWKEAQSLFNQGDLGSAEETCARARLLDRSSSELLCLEQEIKSAAAARAREIVEAARRYLRVDLRRSRVLYKEARALAPDAEEVKRFRSELRLARVANVLLRPWATATRFVSNGIDWANRAPSGPRVWWRARSPKVRPGRLRFREGKKLVYGVALVAGFVAVASLLISVVPRLRESQPRIPPSMPPSGTLVVYAVPWATVTAIEDENGLKREVPPEASTPLSVNVPVGSYIVVLTGPPPASEQRRVQVRAGPAGVTTVSEDFGLTVEEYFQQYFVAAEGGSRASVNAGQASPIGAPGAKVP